MKKWLPSSLEVQGSPLKDSRLKLKDATVKIHVTPITWRFGQKQASLRDLHAILSSWREKSLISKTNEFKWGSMIALRFCINIEISSLLSTSKWWFCMNFGMFNFLLHCAAQSVPERSCASSKAELALVRTSGWLEHVTAKNNSGWSSVFEWDYL